MSRILARIYCLNTSVHIFLVSNIPVQVTLLYGKIHYDQGNENLVSI